MLPRRLQFEKLTSSAGDLFVLVQSKTAGGQIEHRVGRYGASLDEAQGTAAMYKIQEMWDMKEARVLTTEGSRKVQSRTFDLTGGSNFEDESWKKSGENINALFGEAARYGLQHRSDDWFCTVMGPVGNVERPASSRAEASGGAGSSQLDATGGAVPILYVDSPSGELFYRDARGKPSPVRELFSEAYLPPDSDVATQQQTAVQKLDVSVQGKPVDFGQSRWCKLTGVQSEVIEVECRVQKELRVQAGVEADMEKDDEVMDVDEDDIIAHLQHRRLDKMTKGDYGVLVAPKNSTRFLSLDPMAFYADALGTEPFTQNGNLQVLFDTIFNEGTLKGKKPLTYDELVRYMDQPPSFSNESWKAFYDRCYKLTDGFERVCRAIGMGSLAIVHLSPPLQMDFNKSKLVAQPSDTPGLPAPIDAMGSVYRTLVESLFSHEKASLPPPPPPRQPRASNKRPAEAAALTTVRSGGDSGGGGRPSRASPGQPRRLGFNDPNAATEQGGAKRSKSASDKQKATHATRRLKERHASTLEDVVDKVIAAAQAGDTIPSLLLKKLKKSQEDIATDIDQL